MKMAFGDRTYATAFRKFKDDLKERVTKERNKLSVTFMSPDIKDVEHRNMALKAAFSQTMALPPHLYELMVRDVEALQGNEKYQAKFQKYLQIATIEYMEECLQRSKPLCENVCARLYGNHEKAAVVVKEVEVSSIVTEENQHFQDGQQMKLFEGQNVLMVFDYDLESNEGFRVFQGKAYASKCGGAIILFSTGEAKPLSYNVIRRVTIFVKPHLHVFEDRLRGLVALRDDPVIQMKFHPFERVAVNTHTVSVKNLRGSNLNTNQLRAVTEIVHADSSHPFILWGPPGTGKTTTIIEAMIQIFQKDSNARILVLSETNAAADCLTEMLVARLQYIHLNERYYVKRIMAKAREQSSVSEAVKSVSNIDEYGQFSIPYPAHVKKYKIVVSTVSTVTRLHVIGKDHFSHIIFEECAQISEVDIYRAVAPFCSDPTKIILAGDPEQLGPILLCQALSILGPKLLTSMLVRLTRDELYRNFDPHYMVQLLDNYRSNEYIKRFYSILSYDDKLVSKYVEPLDMKLAQNVAHKQIFHHYLHDNYRINDRYLSDVSPWAIPIRWHIIIGEERLDDGTNSIYNLEEMGAVQRYIAKAEMSGVALEDIGVISPYRAQVEKLRSFLKTVHSRYKAVEVGTVLNFQGHEKRFIIVSMVRKKTTGFLEEHRCINTTISRAKNALIIIGNPFVFMQTNLGGHLSFNIRMMRLLKSWKLFVQNHRPLEDGSWDRDNLVKAIESIIPDGDLPGQFDGQFQKGLNELEDEILAQDSNLN